MNIEDIMNGLGTWVEALTDVNLDSYGLVPFARF